MLCDQCYGILGSALHDDAGLWPSLGLPIACFLLLVFENPSTIQCHAFSPSLYHYSVFHHLLLPVPLISTLGAFTLTATAG